MNNYYCSHRPDKYCDNCMEALYQKYLKARDQLNRLIDYVMDQCISPETIKWVLEDNEMAYGPDKLIPVGTEEKEFLVLAQSVIDKKISQTEGFVVTVHRDDFMTCFDSRFKFDSLFDKYRDKLIRLYQEAGWKQVYVKYGKFVLDAAKANSHTNDKFAQLTEAHIINDEMEILCRYNGGGNANIYQ